MLHSSSRFLRYATIGGVAGLLASLSACGGDVSQESSGGGGSGGAAACQSIAAPSKVKLQHVTAEGKAGQGVIGALAEIFASQSPPLVVGPIYSITSLSVSNVWSPVTTPGYSAEITLNQGGEAVSATAVDAQAQTLFEILTSAGTHNCDDPAHGEFIHLSDMTVDVEAAKIEFDDASSYSVPPAPDMIVKGAAAKGVIDAFIQAGIDDCDPAKRAFVVCNKFNGAPSCGYQMTHLDLVDGSLLLNACTPATVDAGPALTSEASAALWDALIGAAKSAGIAPLTGTLDQATVINASYFQWDGEALGCQIVVDTATPPGP